MNLTPTDDSDLFLSIYTLNMTNEDLLSDSENDEDFAYKSDKEEDFSDSDEESRKLQRRIDAENIQANAKEEVKVDKDALRKIYEEMKSGSAVPKEVKPAETATAASSEATQKDTLPAASAATTASTTTTTTTTTTPSTSTSSAPTPTPASIPSSSATNKVKKPKRPKKGSLLDAMNKPKKKLNTLEQSKADWGAFVDKEGIGHDLSQHNKDGYLEKRDFLDTH